MLNINHVYDLPTVTEELSSKVSIPEAQVLVHYVDVAHQTAFQKTAENLTKAESNVQSRDRSHAPPANGTTTINLQKAKRGTTSQATSGNDRTPTRVLPDRR